MQKRVKAEKAGESEPKQIMRRQKEAMTDNTASDIIKLNAKKRNKFYYKTCSSRRIFYTYVINRQLMSHLIQIFN